MSPWQERMTARARNSQQEAKLYSRVAKIQAQVMTMDARAGDHVREEVQAGCDNGSRLLLTAGISHFSPHMSQSCAGRIYGLPDGAQLSVLTCVSSSLLICDLLFLNTPPLFLP